MVATFRKSTQTRARNYPKADNQRYRINRASPNGKGIARLRGFWRVGTCEEANCAQQKNGWVTSLDMSPMQSSREVALQKQRYQYITNRSGRVYTEQWEGSICEFRFEAGQTCFQEHQVAVDRDPRFLFTQGGQMRTLDYDEFFERFNETSHQLQMRERTG